MERAGAVVVEGQVGGRVPGGAHGGSRPVRSHGPCHRGCTARGGATFGGRRRRAPSARVGARVGAHLQHGAVAARDLALHEPGAAAGQVAVVAAADRALDPGVHRLGHPARVGQPEAAGRAVGQQNSTGPSPEAISSTSTASTTASAPFCHVALLTRCQPIRRAASPSGTHRPQEVTTRWAPSPVRRRREHPLVGLEPRREAVGQAVAPEQATKRVAERGHRLPAIGSVTRPPPSPSRAGRSGTAPAARGRRTAPGRRRRRPPGSSAAAAT